MQILITGAYGFLGKNLSLMLQEKGYNNLIKIDRETSQNDIKEGLFNADFVFHLAGTNRAEDENDFHIGNVEFTEHITNVLKSKKTPTDLMFSSSSQAVRDNAYGISKLRAESIIQEYGKTTHSNVFIYRFTNIFGKWSKPNYNSFVATFCNNIANDLDIDIHDKDARVKLIYIDDVCKSLISLLENNDFSSGFLNISPEYDTSVGEVAALLKKFRNSRDSLMIEKVGTGFERALYSTYLSYLSPKKFTYSIPAHNDIRGSFSEMLKTKDSGQISYFTAHPGITRGGHYHHSKNEKFLVLSSRALFRFKNIISGETYELESNPENPKIVETIPGWSHDITNIGKEKMIVLLWANEIFDEEYPDTYPSPLSE